MRIHWLITASLLYFQETVLRLIREAMVKQLEGGKGFLIDGYPREVDQAVKFEEQVS